MSSVGAPGINRLMCTGLVAKITMSNETPSPLDSSDNLAHTPPHVTQSHRSVYSTPKTNISRGSQVSQGARDKLLGLAPDGERCLITLDKEPLHCCHVVARALDHQIVRRPLLVYIRC